MNKSKNTDLIFPSDITQTSKYEQNCVELANQLRFEKCYKLTECIQYSDFNERFVTASQLSDNYHHITKGVETLVQYSLFLVLIWFLPISHSSIKFVLYNMLWRKVPLIIKMQQVHSYTQNMYLPKLAIQTSKYTLIKYIPRYLES